MGRLRIPRYAADVVVSELTDQQRHELVAGIAQAAPQSQLVLDNPVMATGLALLVAIDAALAESNATIAADRVKLKLDLGTEAGHRALFDGQLRTFATMTTTYAKAPTDVTGVGFPSRAPTPGKKLPPEVPASIDTSFPRRGHGKATVSVHETGRSRRQYAAEWSLEPLGPGSWRPLGVGRGKTRLVTGASGTQVWVRFATVRGQLQSDWCTPVLVTLP